MTSAMVPLELPGLEDPDLVWAVVQPQRRSPKLGDGTLYDLYWCGNRTWAAISPTYIPRTFASSDALHAALRAEYGTSDLAAIRQHARITRVSVKDLPDSPTDSGTSASPEEDSQCR
ncbi:hypothetical protein [Streptomyces mirabilis]|uniref:hypothetical protein n=1 Tax=Streptomyces mirabilis TaxID=68239 RepID=UPI0034035C00